MPPPIPPGSFKPGKPCPMGELDPDIGNMELFCVLKPGRGRPARSACNARALAIRSMGRLLTAGGRRAVLRSPVTLEVGCIPAALPWGSETVRREGTRRGGDFEGASRGGSSGVLASEDSSASEPGEAGLLSTCSSGVGGTEESGDSDMMTMEGKEGSREGACADRLSRDVPHVVACLPRS